MLMRWSNFGKEFLTTVSSVDKKLTSFFEVNDAVARAGNDPLWQSLLVELLTSQVLKDDESPVEIDKLEAASLVLRIAGAEQYDENEKAIPAKMESITTLIPTHFKVIIDSCESAM
jgi:hypothetical protein